MEVRKFFAQFISAFRILSISAISFEYSTLVGKIGYCPYGLYVNPV